MFSLAFNCRPKVVLYYQQQKKSTQKYNNNRNTHIQNVKESPPPKMFYGALCINTNPPYVQYAVVHLYMYLPFSMFVALLNAYIPLKINAPRVLYEMLLLFHLKFWAKPSNTYTFPCVFSVVWTRTVFSRWNFRRHAIGILNTNNIS